MGLNNGKEKEGEADCIFASIYTLGIHRHLASFSPNDFDLIIVDEFHHAAAASYKKSSIILNHSFYSALLLHQTVWMGRMSMQPVMVM